MARRARRIVPALSPVGPQPCLWRFRCDIAVPMILLTLIFVRTTLEQMARRDTTSVCFAAWALLLLPALCTGGAVGHACECGDADSCCHETDCPSDPCSQVTAVRAQRSSELVLTGPTPVTCSLLCVILPQSFSVETTDRAFEVLAQPTLPYPPSDVPLLI